MKKKSHDEFINELKIKNPNILILGTYINCSTKIKVKCQKCNNIWETIPNSLVQGHGCPKCNGKKLKRAKKLVISTFKKTNIK